MNVNPEISFFNQCLEDTVNFFDTFFKGNETLESKENPFKKLPKELIQTIFTFVPVQTRLSDVPSVCHHFYDLARPFSKKCFDLYIPNFINELIKEKGVFDNGKYLYIFNSKANQSLSLYISRFDISCDSEKECTELFQSAIQSYINILNQNDKFDNLSFIKQSDLADKHSWTEHKIISNGGFSSGRRMEILEIERSKIFITFLCNLDDQKLHMIAEILCNFRSNDLMKLKNDLLSRFEKEEQEDIVDILMNGQGHLIDIFLRMAMMKPNNFKLFFNFDLLDFISVTQDKCFEKLKASINELSKKYDFTCDYKNNLFFIDQKVKGLVFSSYQPELIYPAKLAPEYRWFADRFMNK